MFVPRTWFSERPCQFTHDEIRLSTSGEMSQTFPLSPLVRKQPPRTNPNFRNFHPEPPHQSNTFERYLPESVAVFCANNTGLLFVAGSQVFFSLMNITVKYFLSITSISVLTLIAVRMVITSAGCVIALYFLGDPNWLGGPPEMRYMLAARGTLGFCGLLSNYQSFKGLSVSDSTAIQFLAPSVTAFLGYMFLGESLSRGELLTGACCLVGVALVSRPPFLFGYGSGQFLPPGDPGPRAIPGEGEDSGSSTSERMIAVGWAISAVFSAAGACESTPDVSDQGCIGD